jgi:rSAM/selenodomain-associated transferase 2
LIFLHADTRLPPDAPALIHEALAAGARWGRFDVRLSGARLLLRVVECMMNWRSRLSGIATGDQAIFVRRDLFRQLGGFADIALMEDVEFSRRAKRLAPPACLRACVETSSRRWEQRGVLRTVLLMMRLRLAYFLGADPRELARRYARG